MDYKVIDVGTHANPPADLWVERFPDAVKHLAPVKEMRRNDHGEYEVLVCEGVDIRPLNSTVGVFYENFYGDGPWAQRFSDGVPGGYDPHARIADMDRDGVDAQVIVRGLHGGGAGPDLSPDNLETWLHLIRVYNDWITEFCAVAPNRLFGVGELPTWDMNLMLEEARAIKKRGLRAVLMPIVPGKATEWSTPAPIDYTSDWWEPLWTELERLDLIVVSHVDSANATPSLSGYGNALAPALANVAANKSVASEMVASLILSGVLDRHPKLRFVLNETGIGWAAHLVSWMDVHVDRQWRSYKRLGLTRKPSQYWRDHFMASILWDSCGIANRDLIGIETFAWCSDYPESYGTFRYAAKQHEADFAACTPEERHAILAGNAMRVFGL